MGLDGLWCCLCTYLTHLVGVRDLAEIFCHMFWRRLCVSGHSPTRWADIHQANTCPWIKTAQTPQMLATQTTPSKARGSNPLFTTGSMSEQRNI